MLVLCWLKHCVFVLLCCVYSVLVCVGVVAVCDVVSFVQFKKHRVKIMLLVVLWCGILCVCLNCVVL